tara:strand:+ start:589 stop:1182 length:594 start_codon:yes stop_codon:yes gene_type:complete
MMTEPQGQEQEQEQPMPFFNRPIADDSLGSLQYQLDNYDIIEDVIHDLKKEVQIIGRDGKIIWQAKYGTQALINEQGLGNIISTLKSRLNKIISLSDLPDEVINRIVHDIHEDLTDDFYYNFEIYKIKDIATASMIISLVTDTVYSTLRKGYMGNYMKLLRSMHSIQEIQQGQIRNPMPQVQSMSDRIGGMLFRKRR